jgi:DNA-binding MarR family transcriptional regulator
MQLLAAGNTEMARQLAGLFQYIASASNREVLPEISALDLSLTQVKALALLEERGQALSVGELAEGLGLSVAATSRSVDGLVKRALVERAEDPVDRRVKRVRTTARARKAYQRIVALRTATLTRLIESLTADERTKLAAALDALGEREEVRRHYPR